MASSASILPDSIELANAQVIEPEIGFPVVQTEILVARAGEGLRIVDRQEGRRRVVDEPVDAAALAHDLEVILLPDRDLGLGAGDDVLSVLVSARDDRLRVSPAAEDEHVARRGVGAAGLGEGLAVAPDLELDVPGRRARPGV